MSHNALVSPDASEKKVRAISSAAKPLALTIQMAKEIVALLLCANQMASAEMEEPFTIGSIICRWEESSWYLCAKGRKPRHHTHARSRMWKRRHGSIAVGRDR